MQNGFCYLKKSIVKNIVSKYCNAFVNKYWYYYWQYFLASITGCMVVQHRVNGDQALGNGEFRPLTESKPLNRFI